MNKRTGALVECAFGSEYPSRRRVQLPYRWVVAYEHRNAMATSDSVLTSPHRPSGHPRQHDNKPARSGAPRIVGTVVCNVLLRHQSNRVIETSASSSAGSTKRYRNTRHSPSHSGERPTHHQSRNETGSEAAAPQKHMSTHPGIMRGGAAAYMLSAPARSATCAAFFASTTFRISAGSPSCPRATRSVWRGARKVVEPG